MYQFILAIHIIISVFLVILVLLQQTKTGSLSGTFAGGASQTVFGSQGSGSFLVRLTAIFAALFFCTSIALSYLLAHQAKQGSQNLGFSVPASARPAPVNTPKSEADRKLLNQPATDVITDKQPSSSENKLSAPTSSDLSAEEKTLPATNNAKSETTSAASSIVTKSATKTKSGLNSSSTSQSSVQKSKAKSSNAAQGKTTKAVEKKSSLQQKNSQQKNSTSSSTKQLKSEHNTGAQNSRTQ